MIRKRIEMLRALMLKNDIQAYIITSQDYHSSEYVGDYFKAREYMSGFNGSAGTLVVTADEALLWTDGRYFLQAAEQLEGSDITLMKSREKGVPTIAEYLFGHLDYSTTLGFDGRTVSNSFAGELIDVLSCKQISIKSDIDLVGGLWTDRPPMPCEPVWELDLRYAGVSRADKLSRVREKMNASADVLIITALDEIAWLLNLRGSDVECTPVFLSYMAIEANGAILFTDKRRLSDEVLVSLDCAGVEIREYSAFADYLKAIEASEIVQLDFSTADFSTVSLIDPDACIIDEVSPVCLLKSVKNDIEAANIRRAHILDGVALCRFIYRLKNGKTITELEAVDLLRELRAENEGYIEESFDAIVAYGAHGAIVHYEPDEASNVVIEKSSLCLVDTGGHYLEGTTDVTRTIAMGGLSDEEKKAFTIALKGHLALARARFPYGAYGESIDAIARAPLWAYGMDYNHGTGHGVGYLLGVHEGPQSISYRGASGKNHFPIEQGMLISNEPGYYKEGCFGIRHECLVLAKKDDDGFMHFETLTLAPFDIDAIDLQYLDEAERAQLNAYHKRVFDTISPYLDEDEAIWLRHATRRI